MSLTLAGMATSHAYTFIPPQDWDSARARTRRSYERRHGTPPPDHPRIAETTVEQDVERYRAFAGTLEELRTELTRFDPEVLVIVGDDQSEHYTDTVPQFAVFTGDRVRSDDRVGGGKGEFACDAGTAEHLLSVANDDGFDVVRASAFEGSDLMYAHAHAQILSFLQPSVPVVLVFVNATHLPAPGPERCYRFGESLRRGLDAAGIGRAVVYASGGLSHFSASYPYADANGEHDLGEICEEFDHGLIAAMRAGDDATIRALTSQDLLRNGDVEFRQWIVMLGALGEVRPAWIEYQPFYRAITGMAAGYWPAAS